MPVLPISRSSVPDSVSFLLSFSCDEWAQRTALIGALFSHKHLGELPFSFLIFRAFGLIFDRLKSISTGGWGANKRWLKCRSWYWISAVEPMQIFLLLSEGSVRYYCLTWAFFFCFVLMDLCGPLFLFVTFFLCVPCLMLDDTHIPTLVVYLPDWQLDSLLSALTARLQNSFCLIPSSIIVMSSNKTKHKMATIRYSAPL